jgi:hypothetical protein
MAAIASSTFALQSSTSVRAEARREAEKEFQAMSKAMIAERGLLNHAQAALLLDVSTKRVGELVKLGKLTDFNFLGRKYVSMREVWARNKQELKAGRPPRSFVKRAAASLGAAAKTDRNQARLGGYSGPYQKQLEQQHKAERREKYRAKWREIRGSQEMNPVTAVFDGDWLVSLDERVECLAGSAKRQSIDALLRNSSTAGQRGKISRLFRSDLIRVIEQMKEKRDKNMDT